MNNDNKIYEQIEAYLNGKLNGKELASFENLIISDHLLQEKISNHKLANLLIKKNSLLNIRDLIQQEDSAVKKNNLYKTILAVVIFTGLGVLGIWAFSNKTTENSHRVPDKPVATETTQVISKALPIKKITEPEKKIFHVKSVTTSKPLIKEEKAFASELENVPVAVMEPAEPVKEIQQLITVSKTGEKESIALVPRAKESIIDHCLNTELTAHVTVHPACKGEDNGSIYVSGYKGGKSPYTAEIFFNHTQILPNTHISHGQYEVTIKDAKGCIKHLGPVEVKETNCSKEFFLNPYTGENLDLPVYPLNGIFVVYDEAGNVYFTTEIAAGAREKWNGYSNKGELKTGYFPFNVKYDDGSIKHGSISIGK